VSILIAILNFRLIELCFGRLAALQQFIVQCENKSLYVVVKFRRQPGKGVFMLTSFIRYVRSWREYGATVRELSSLSDRELADLGITRSEIPHIAFEHLRH
jgi:uncharacterized protein YjiS (DUF1127 family)